MRKGKGSEAAVGQTHRQWRQIPFPKSKFQHRTIHETPAKAHACPYVDMQCISSQSHMLRSKWKITTGKIRQNNFYDRVTMRQKEVGTTWNITGDRKYTFCWILLILRSPKVTVARYRVICLVHLYSHILFWLWSKWFVCGRRRVTVTRQRTICLVLWQIWSQYLKRWQEVLWQTSFFISKCQYLYLN